MGGTGVFGSLATAILAADALVEEVVVACRNVDRAHALRDRMGSKVVPRQMDLTSEGDVRAAARDCDVVMNAVGPAYMYGRFALGAAIDAGKPYVDLCDDAKAAEELLGFGPQAKRTGTTAVVGLGCSPGVTNLIAKSAERELGQIERITVLHGGTAEASLGGVANLMHMFDLIDGDVPVVRDGKVTTLAGFSELEPHDFGPPLGTIDCGVIAHPEPIMFVRSFPHLQESTVKLGLVPATANHLLSASAAFGLTREEPTYVDDVGINPREFLAVHLHNWQNQNLDEDKLADVLFSVHIIVQGRNGGKERTKVFQAFGDVGRLIAAAVALGALWLGTGRIEGAGVYSAEQCVDAVSFLNGLEALGCTIPVASERATDD